MQQCESLVCLYGEGTGTVTKQCQRLEGHERKHRWRDKDRPTAKIVWVGP